MFKRGKNSNEFGESPCLMLKNNFHVPYLQFPDTVLLDDYKMQLGFPKETARSAFLEHVESPGQKLRRAW